MRAAIYARVSTERQEQQQTIGSQVAALRDWAAARDHVLAEAHVFRDEGYSGSRLDRPALDALRDAVRDAAVDVVAVFSPDRLARKYAYQVLLMEEFRRAGCEVAFLHRPISDDPNDQLLLQIQGAVAEYERAVLAERFRRGKLQRARDGGIVGSKAPYGYRYEGRRGAVLARLVVDEAEAAMVRDLYAWVVEDGLTVRQCTKRLDAGPWVTRSGRAQWSSSVVHHILTDPVYVGVTYANRFDYVAPRQRRGHSRRGTERTCRRPRPPEQWIAVPVPPLVDRRTWDGARVGIGRLLQAGLLLLAHLHELAAKMDSTPHDPALDYEIGMVFLRNGRDKDGVRWLGYALLEDPKHRPAHRALAKYYERAGNKKLAERHRRLAEQE